VAFLVKVGTFLFSLRALSVSRTTAYQGMIDIKDRVRNVFRLRKTFGDDGLSRENNLDVVRLILAISVIVSHAFPLTGNENSEPVFAFTSGRVDIGKLAVDAFFVISGFLISNSWIRGRGWWDFWRKRGARIYPAFLAALLLSILVVAPLGGAEFPVFLSKWDTWQQVLCPLLFGEINTLQGVFETNSKPGILNGSLWTIRFEVFCYLLVAVIGLLGFFKHRMVVFCTYICALLFYRFNPQAIVLSYFGSLYELPRLLAYFFGGAAIYIWRHRIPRSIALFSCCAALLYLSRGHSIGLLWPLLFPYCVMYLGLSRKLSAFAVLAGIDISYGVYLYAWPIQQLLVGRFQMLSPIVNAIVAIPLSCFAGFLSWHSLEKHFLKMAKNGSNLSA